MSAEAPARYAALLRGINVSDSTAIPMAELREVLTGLGHEDVKTLLRSGNAVFTASEADPARLAAGIEAALCDRFGFTPPTLVLTHPQLAAVIEANPYPSAEEEPAKHLVQFLLKPLTKAERARIEAFDAEAYRPEEFQVGVDVLYFRFPGGIGRSALDVAFGRHVGATTVMTGRNWNTVRKLHDLTA